MKYYKTASDRRPDPERLDNRLSRGRPALGARRGRARLQRLKAKFSIRVFRLCSAPHAAPSKQLGRCSFPNAKLTILQDLRR